jgi:pimeloyl-ACP methyl ester carboxylesterase
VRALTDLIESLHTRIAGAPDRERLSGIPGLVYRNIRGINGLIGSANAAIARRLPAVEEHRSTPEREAILAAVNGVIGDYLLETQNPLAVRMSLRRDGQTLPLDLPGLAAAMPKPGSKLLVLVHGLCMNDRNWTTPEHDFGGSLEHDLGYTCLHLRYNSGLHISANGREFADLLEALVAGWPVPIEELSILSHSMGGLVARSACMSAAREGQRWPRRLRKLVFLGTPHHGAPLERGGLWLQTALGMSAYTEPFARLGKLRSAGITDMRYSCINQEDWENGDRFDPNDAACRPAPLPEGVHCYTIAARLTGKAPPAWNDFIGDGLVPLDSALGIHPDPHLDLAIPEQNRWVASPVNHLELLRNPEVYARVRQWLRE